MRSSSMQKSSSAKHFVGSIHSGGLNYHQDMHAFSSACVPEKAKEAVEFIRSLKTADILGLQGRNWNKSTYVDRAKYYSEQLAPMRRNFEIRMGFLDQQVPTWKPTKVYQGTETRDFFENWNVSNQVQRKELTRNLNNFTEKAKTASAKKLKELKNYVKPPLVQTAISRKIREEKVEDEELREKIRAEYVYEFPKSSEEKTAAEVFKRICQYKLKAKQGEAANLMTGEETFKPQLSKKSQRRYQKMRMHNGLWGTSEFTKKEAWSCCLNEEFKSLGCVEKIRDLDRWITISL